MKPWHGPAQPELRAKLRALIDASAAIDRPSANDRQRVRARVAAAIAAATPAPAPKASASAAGSARAPQLTHIGLGAMVKQSLLAMVVGASVTGAVLWAREPGTRPYHVAPRAPVARRVAGAPPLEFARPNASPPSAATPEHGESRLPPSAATSDDTTPPPPARAKREHKPHAPHPRAAPMAPTAPPPPDSAPVDVAARSAPLPPPSAASASPAGRTSLSEELALMMAAQHALAANQLTRALALLDQHQKRFPAGALVPERIAARAVALCRSQRHDDGARELQTLVERAPNSPLVGWARADCRNDPR